MKRETKFAGVMKKILEQYNCSILNVHGHMMQSVGWPDFYVAHKIVGQFWIEFKVAPNTLSVSQRQRINELLNKSVPVFVIELNEFGITFSLSDLVRSVKCLSENSVVWKTICEMLEEFGVQNFS